MLSRLIPKPSSLRILTLISSKSPVIPHARQPPIFISHLRTLCTNRNNGGNDGKDDTWKFSEDIETKLDPFFAETSGSLSGGSPAAENDSWLESNEDEDSNVFEGIEKEENAVPPRRDSGGGGDDWLTAEENSTWNLADEGKDYEFDVGVQAPREDDEIESRARSEIEEVMKNEQLEREKKELTAILQGPDRAFGDLISASGITDEMLDSLIALKDFQGVDGLPPLTQLEDERYEKNTKKSSRAEIERQKQEEVAKSRVRKVDEKGKAYGTGRRKCSIARVWIQPGDGNFVINDKEFDVYFPMLDHRAALLRPFSETKSLGLWDVKCTVKGGGTTGQVGAIQLGISRALQNWEPDLRPPLRAAGFLTRDPRVVERKKPGKAKARKSFQWVKR